MGRFLKAALSLSLVLFCLISCSGEKQPGKPSVLLVTVDTMRADRIGAYGCRDVETPNIDRLAGDGVLFARAYSAVPLTLPSHATILTGLYPPGHGIRNNGNYRLPEEAVTMAEVLRGAGYATAAFVGAFVLDSQFALDQGFDLYHDSFLNIDAASGPFTYAERRAGEVTGLAAEWLGKVKEPFFLWVHYFDPHYPYAPPPPFDERYRDAPYLGEIAYADACFGSLLGALEKKGKRGNTLVILTSDHGESLGEHGEESHGVFLYEAPVRVPLVMAMEGVLPEGSRIEGDASLADIFPTVLDVLGIAVPPTVQGRSLLPLLGGGPSGESPLYMETLLPLENFGWSEVKGLVSGRYKYLRVPETELYDLAVDPAESMNIARREPGLAARLDSLLSQLESGYAREAPSAAFRQMDEETRAKLESLGYVWRSPALAGSAKPDPKKMIRIVAETEAAKRLFEEGRFDDAARVFEGILVRDPGNVTAHNLLGMVLSRAGDTEGAVTHWRKALELSPGYLETYRNLGALLREKGDLDASAALLGEALAQNPEYTKAHLELGLTLREMGKRKEARAEFTRALELDPDFAQTYVFLGALSRESGDTDSALYYYRGALARDTTSIEARRSAAKLLQRKGEVSESLRHFGWVARRENDAPSYVDLGKALERAGKGEEAAGAYRQAVRLDSLAVEAYNNLGIALFKLGRYEEAEESLKKAAGLSPDYAEPHFNLGNLYRRTGRTEEAIQSYSRFLDLWKGDEETRKRAFETVEQLRGGG
jgi:arylsulfatase A-like enzyme/Flp pilus assembly protein TadD